jgi:pyruvate formate lyase activating enzyme
MMEQTTLDTLNATYLHLQRLSTEDGPGIRTTVFLKGCSLHCAWCHNPESIASKPFLQWQSQLCIGCQTCILSCPNDSLRMEEGILRVDRNVCRLCGECADACPANALEILGKKIYSSELIDELMKDSAFFARSGGGVTFSGGEPALQPEFTAAVMETLHEQGIHTALDTCGNVPRASLEMILPYTDLVLYDIKIMDSEQHKLFTRAGNELILENLRWLVHYIRQEAPSMRLWIRTPLIPRATTTQTNLQAIAAFLNELDDAIERWELCAFNNLCRDKYARLGMHWDYTDQPLMTQAELDECQTWARAVYQKPHIVNVTGAARFEQSEG